MHLGFSFRKFKIERAKAMKMAGYTYRYGPNDWVRREGQSMRFHAKPAGANGIELHTDIYTGEGAHHYTFPLDLTMKDEIQRIMGVIRWSRERR